ncbi:MAG: molybdenum cofactor guanylyltransferase [Dermatophilaceae bacterium]
MPPSPTASSQTTTSAIVLCGGASRRMGGVDKTRALLGATTVLDRLLNTLPSCWDVVCVGEERPTNRAVTWCRESPPGGGPVAGIAAGLLAVDSPVCVVVGGDMPFAATTLTLCYLTLQASPTDDGVLGVSPDGRTQPLLAAYRTAALRRAMPAAGRGARLMPLLDAMELGKVPCEAEAALDVDTPEALEQARHIVGT